MNIIYKSLFILIVLTLSACSKGNFLLDIFTPKESSLLDEIKLADEIIVQDELIQPNISLDDVLDSYQNLYSQISYSNLSYLIIQRISDIRSNNRLDSTEFHVIDLYEKLLLTENIWTKNDQIYYQLAKEYELKGKIDKVIYYLTLLIKEYPDSEFFYEANFRIAEIYFSTKKYVLANNYYTGVLDIPDKTNPLYMRSLYMKSWSDFKLNDFEGSLDKAFNLLSIKQKEGFEYLSVSKSLREDIFRLISLNFLYQEGVSTFQNNLDRIEKTNFEYDFYRYFSKFLLEKKYYLDASSVLKIYINRNSTDERSLFLFDDIINILKIQGFASKIYNIQKIYIQKFNQKSPIWSKTKEMPEVHRKRLENYLVSVSNIMHVAYQKKPSLEASNIIINYYRQISGISKNKEERVKYIYLIGELYRDSNRYREALIVYHELLLLFL